MLLNNKWVKSKIKKKSKDTLTQMKMETPPPKSTGHSKSSSKITIYSNTGLPQESRKISKKQSKLTPKTP